MTEPFWGSAPSAWKLEPDDVHVWSAVLDQPPTRLLALDSVLAPEERLKISRLHRARDRERALAARGFLREILASYLQLVPAAIRFHYGTNGKPSLADGQGSLQFNLSHAGALFLCALSSSCEVGVDVEQTGNIPAGDTEAIAQRFFTEEEKADYREASDDQKQVAFYKLWTRKEAIAKCLGHGIAQERSVEGFKGAIIDLTPAAGYIGSLAVQSGACRLQTWHWPDSPE
jgi:4'-phosphopantetheinyl transferase